MMNLYCVISFLSLFNNVFCASRSKKSLFILPGTNWCGSDNRAVNCDDLGDYFESDKCCRKHDNCPLFLTRESRNFGFKWNGLYTLSHCECDVLFYDCLHELPYKENSNYIWSFYESLETKCFAFLPCLTDSEQDSEFNNIWNMKSNRKSGFCVNGFKLMTFHSVMDYNSFMKKHLTKDQLNLIVKFIENNITRLFSKSYGVCKDKFKTYDKDMLNSFISKVLYQPLNQIAEPKNLVQEKKKQTRNKGLSTFVFYALIICFVVPCSMILISSCLVKTYKLIASH